MRCLCAACYDGGNTFYESCCLAIGSRSQPQGGVMSKPLLQTTIVGSLPKPSWLAQPSKLWAPWAQEGDTLAEAKRDATCLAIRDQERAGIDIIGDGEQSR